MNKPMAERKTGTMLRLTLSKRTAESEGARAEQTFRTIARRLHDGLIVTDAKGRVAYLNPAAAALTGWSKRAVVGKPVAKVVVIPPGQRSSPLHQLVRKVL